MIPLTLILGAILIFPLLYSLVISFQNYELSKIGQEHFVGIDNYINVFGDRAFWAAMRNTITFVVIAVSIEVTLGFFLAILLHNKATFLRGFFQSTLLSPMFITPIAVGLIFRFLTNSQLGVIPNLLKNFNIQIDFFGPKLALFSIALIDTWQWTPFMLLLILRAWNRYLKNLSKPRRWMAQKVWRMIWYVTLPLMRPILLAAVMIRMLDAFKIYEYVYAITRGGPGVATETMQYFIYRPVLSTFAPVRQPPCPTPSFL